MLQYGSNVYIFTHLEEKTQEDFEFALEKSICNTYKDVLYYAREERAMVTIADIIKAALPQMAKYGFDYVNPITSTIGFDGSYIEDEKSCFLQTARGATVWNKIAEHNNKYL